MQNIACRRVTENLVYCKLFTDIHKTQRIPSAHAFGLIRERRESEDNFFYYNVTGDEMWIFYINIKPKQQSMQWQRLCSPKVKTSSKSCENRISCPLFSRIKMCFFTEFMELEITVKANSTFKTDAYNLVLVTWEADIRNCLIYNAPLAHFCLHCSRFSNFKVNLLTLSLQSRPCNE